LWPISPVTITHAARDAMPREANVTTSATANDIVHTFPSSEISGPSRQAVCRQLAVKAVSAASRVAATFAVVAAAVFAAAVPAHAQQSQSPPERRVMVIGEGSVRVAPDYAQITSGVITRAKTAKAP
jgi:hypothetical protein